jgi:hypothetical protein
VYESGVVDAHEAVAMTVKASSSNFCDFITDLLVLRYVKAHLYFYHTSC